MKENAIITVHGQQTMDAPDEPIELVTIGEFFKKDDAYVIIYNESELTGLENTVTTIEAYPQKVVISRNGQHSSQLVFEQGKQHITAYDAELMSLTMTLYTRKVRTELTDSGGIIDVQYSIDLEGFATTQNVFKLEVRLAQ